MPYKALFSESLKAPTLHVAAHSHHLWPDASREGQMTAWADAARLADTKWDHIFSHVYPAAQAHVAEELKLPKADTIAFAPNTHDLIVRLVSALPGRSSGYPLRIVTTDCEFHSARRQFQRWAEDGEILLDIVPTAPWETFPERLLDAAGAADTDLVFVSQVFFSTGRVLHPDVLAALAALSEPLGRWVVIDGYHGFMAVPTDLSALSDRLFYLSGGYKYAMSGEGVCFLHAPDGYGPRPAITGWYAAFGALAGPQGEIGYAPDGGRFLGATFDPSGLYRFNAVRDLIKGEGLDTARISAYVSGLLDRLRAALASGEAGKLSEATLLNPPEAHGQARFLALKHSDAQSWYAALKAAGVITDVRDDVLRIGLGLYHDEADLARLLDVARRVL